MPAPSSNAFFPLIDPSIASTCTQAPALSCLMQPLPVKFSTMYVQLNMERPCKHSQYQRRRNTRLLLLGKQEACL